MIGSSEGAADADQLFGTFSLLDALALIATFVAVVVQAIIRGVRRLIGGQPPRLR